MDDNLDIVSRWRLIQNHLDFMYHHRTRPKEPSKDELDKLNDCDVEMHNSSCFEEGTCLYPFRKGCGFKK